MTDLQARHPGWIALRERRYQEAETLFLTAFEQEPNAFEHLDGLSQALMGRGAWLEAAGIAELITQDPRRAASAWERAADCYFRAQSHRDWVRAHQECLNAEPPTQARLLTFARRLMTVSQTGEALRLLNRACRMNPEASEVYEALADVHLTMGATQLAIRDLSTVAALNPNNSNALSKLSGLLNQRVPTWHFPMMNDVPRNQAFEEAIIARLSPGDTVLDIGCGAGLLSLMAARAGAESVLAIEGEDAVADAAEKIFERNGYEEQIQLIRGRSTTKSVGKDLPKRADLLVSEIFDVSLLGEDALYTIKHAHEHLLKPNAKVIPAEARIWCALVESDDLRARFHVDTSCGFDLSEFNQLRDPRVLQLDLGRFDYRLLTEPVLAMNFSFEGDVQLSGEQISAINAISGGRADGFIFWYDLVLAPATEDRDEIILSTSPLQENTHWLQGFAPCYGDHAPIEEGELVSFLCAYRRFLLWFQLF